MFIGDDPEAIDYLSELSEKTGGKLYRSIDIVETFFDVIFDIGQDLSNPDTPSQSVPEPSPVFDLLALGVGKFLQRSIA